MPDLETKITKSQPAETVLDLYAEGQRYFRGKGSLNNALSQLAADLKSHGIDYAVIGAVALLAHGYPRFTEDIDLVLTPEGLETFSSRAHRSGVRVFRKPGRNCVQLEIASPLK